MCKILLADDEYLEREALKIIIRQGMKDAEIVGEAGFGREAVELSQKYKPTVIFMDIKMPGIDGIKATEIIKKDNPNTVVIILTAYDEFSLAQKAIKAGADDYILKPARPEEIIAAIKRHMQKSKIHHLVEQEEKTLELLHNGDYQDFKRKLAHLLTEIANEEQSNIDSFRTRIIQLVTQIFKTSHRISRNSEKLIRLQFESTYELSLQKGIHNITTWVMRLTDDINEIILGEKDIKPTRELELAIQYIDNNLQKGITLDEVAKHVGLSSFYLSKLFKKQIGINFIEYVTKKKVEKAKNLLLHTNLPVINIALDLGFHEPNYFSKVFKKVEGITPTQYREQMGSIQ
ncbi:MAG: response regulator [Thermotaleaceae bacterium]